MRKRIFSCAGAALALFCTGAAASDLAEAFGARPAIGNVRISPDGTHVGFLSPMPGGRSALVVTEMATGKSDVVVSGTADVRLRYCEWGSNDALFCQLSSESQIMSGTSYTDFSTYVGVSRATGKLTKLGLQQAGTRALGFSTSLGEVIHNFGDGTVLMQRYVAAETTIGTRLARERGGLVAERVDIESGTRRTVEAVRPDASRYMADQNGQVRLMYSYQFDTDGYVKDSRTVLVRAKEAGQWAAISTAQPWDAFIPLAFDDSGDWIYALVPKDGRQALYRVAADGSNRRELVLADGRVDIGNVETIGTAGRVIGAYWEDERPHRKFFDADLAKVEAQVARALKGNPVIGFTSESADRRKVVIYAGSDRDPGRYYLLDRDKREMNEILPVAPKLTDVPLADMKPVSFPARDGVQVPAYLTLPPTGPQKGLPAIVLPHGGPSARDSWGFDWLAQFWAANGYAVIQPNYRGSAGYGDEWFANNGFRGWDVAMRDVNDAARWLVQQGIADRGKLAIVGWSYGGYAALLAPTLEPGLYKGVVAIAPVTDLDLLRQQDRMFSNARVSADFIGKAGPLASPARRGQEMTAPVLLFHGDRDTNVDIGHSRKMEQALKGAGKPVDLTVYPGLDHQIDDSSARTDMLRKSAAFIGRLMGKAGAGTAAVGGK